MTRKSFVFVIAICLIYLFINFISYHLIVKKIKLEQVQLREQLPQIMMDLNRLKQNPIFLSSAKTKNAEELLGEHVYWITAGDKAENPEKENSLKKLFKKYPNWRDDTHQLASLYKDSVLEKIDTSWLDAVLNYSHWDISQNPQFIEKLESINEQQKLGHIDSIIQLPRPDYEQLRLYAIVHFLKLQNKNQWHNGYLIYRKVSELIHSSAKLEGSLVSAKMLLDEHAFARYFNLTSWPLIHRPRIEAYSRLSRAWVSLLNYAIYQPLPKTILESIDERNGSCSGVREGVIRIALVKGHIDLPLVEKNEYFKHIKGAQSTFSKSLNECGLDHFVDKIYGSTASTFELNFLRRTEKNSRYLYLLFPDFMEARGLSYMTSAKPPFLSPYLQN